MCDKETELDTEIFETLTAEAILPHIAPTAAISLLKKEAEFFNPDDHVGLTSLQLRCARALAQGFGALEIDHPVLQSQPKILCWLLKQAKRRLGALPTY
jgi:hypothetical protein